MKSQNPALPPTPRRRLAVLWLAGCAVLAAVAAAALASLIALWLPSGPWAGPLAAAMTGALVAPPLAWHVLRLRGALQRAHLRAADGPAGEGGAAGMLTRGLFLGFVEREWSRAGRYGGTVALLLIELDGLRARVDASGAWVADALIAALGNDIQKRLRGADLLARYTEGQIVVFLPHADPTGALDVADRIRASVEKLEVPDPLAVAKPLTTSIGVVVMRPQLHPLAALLTDAGAAVQAALDAGGNCVRMAPTDRRRRLQRRPASGGHPATRDGE